MPAGGVAHRGSPRFRRSARSLPHPKGVRTVRIPVAAGPSPARGPPSPLLLAALALLLAGLFVAVTLAAVVAAIVIPAVIAGVAVAIAWTRRRRRRTAAPR